jgi:enoyl-CoA hydratase
VHDSADMYVGGLQARLCMLGWAIFQEKAKTMGWNYVTVERSGRVAVVKFTRGDSLNALSVDLMHELIDVARSFRDDTETLAVVLAGEGAFSAGMDLRDPRFTEGMQGPLGKRRRLLSAGPNMCSAWEDVEQVTIAAVEKHCVGGGVSLAVSCDFRIMGRSAIFRVPELALGLNMSWQTLPRLAHLVGPARTKQIVILAEPVSSAEALAWGLVEDVAEDDNVIAKAVAMAEKIAAMPPLPVKMTKRAVNAAVNALDSTASYMDIDQFMLCQMTEDYGEAISGFFAKRKPVFKGE